MAVIKIELEEVPQALADDMTAFSIPACCDDPTPDTGVRANSGDRVQVDLYCRACDKTFGFISWKR